MSRASKTDPRLLVGGATAVLLLVIALLVPLAQNVYGLQGSVEKQRHELARLRSRPAAAAPSRQLAVPDLPGEPAVFLSLLSRELRATECRLVSLDLLPAAPETADKENRVLVRAIRTRIGLRGRYPALRRLVDRLGAAERLLTVVDLTVRSRPGAGTPGAPTVEASLIIERYLTAASPRAVNPATLSVARDVIAGTAAVSAARPGERNP